MKKQIQYLVELGIYETEALTIVRNIAMHAFYEGENNMSIYYDYNDYAKLEADKLFDDWFKKELTR